MIRSDSLFDDEERILERHLVRALFLLFHKVDVTDLFLSEICCHIFILHSLQYLRGIASSKSCLKGRWVCASVVAAALRSSLQSEVFLTISWRSGPELSSLPGRFAFEKVAQALGKVGSWESASQVIFCLPENDET